MKLDIRKRINNSFLYKRFAYDSEGFIALMKFLEDENIVDEFCKECNFKRSCLADDLEFGKKEISLKTFFLSGYSYSFSFSESKKGYDFWHYKIFENEDFYKIGNKLL